MNALTPGTLSAAVTLVPATRGHSDEVAALWHAAWGDGHLGHVPDCLLHHRTPAAFRRRTADRLDAMTVAVDTGDFDNSADTEDRIVLVPTRRYEKRVRSQQEDAR